MKTDIFVTEYWKGGEKNLYKTVIVLHSPRVNKQLWNIIYQILWLYRISIWHGRLTKMKRASYNLGLLQCEFSYPITFFFPTSLPVCLCANWGEASPSSSAWPHPLPLICQKVSSVQWSKPYQNSCFSLVHPVFPDHIPPKLRSIILNSSSFAIIPFRKYCLRFRICRQILYYNTTAFSVKIIGT